MEPLARTPRSTHHGDYARVRLPALVAGLLLGLVAAGPALGHAELEQSMPEDGEVLTAPPTFVTLAFTEGLNAEKSSFRLVKDGTDVATGSASGDGETTMSATDLTLEPGDYVIRWTAVAEDGHVERGRLTFSVEEPPSPSPTPTPTPTPTAAASDASSASPSATPAATASATPAPSPSADTTPVASGGSDILLPIVAALAIVGVVAYLVLRRGRTA